MKNYKQILEAVNRGIKFALDDFEDQEDIQSLVNSKVKYHGGMNEYIDLMLEVVDLGLPSGTLWCKYNLGVNQNLLSKAEDWYGGYYAWGEITNKNKIYYEWNTYKFCHAYHLTKYYKDDDLTELLPEDDAACLTKKLHNYKFHIPTKEQCEELIKYTKNYWVKNYDPNKPKHNTNDFGIQGLNGRVFEGKNGNQLFIPAAGYRGGSNISGDGLDCNLWSSSLDLFNPAGAHYLDFDSVCIDTLSRIRYIGLSVRPVINL